MTYAADILARSPLAYYRLNEVSSLVDSSGNARHGTFVGGTPTVVAGKVIGDSDQAVNFAASARAEVADAAWMDVGSFTVLATITPTAVAAATQEIACRYNGTASGTWAANSWALRLATNKLQAGVFYGASNFTGTTGTVVLVAGTTYDVAMTYDSTTGALKGYVNGVLDSTATRLGMQNASTPITIGATQAATEPFTGGIDEVVYVPTILTDAQIATLSWSRRGEPTVLGRAHVLTAEVLGSTSPDGRAHAVTTEVLGEGTPTSQVHGVAAEVLGSLYDPPNVPTGVVASVGPRGVTLNWSAPSGGGPVSDYEVRCNGRSDSVVPTQFTFEMSRYSLVSGVEYDFEVRASGIGGNSSWVSVDKFAPFVMRTAFTADGTFTPPDHCEQVEVLIVGGGGAGGRYVNGGGGAGAGGVRYETISVTPGVPVSIVVGAGAPTTLVDGNGANGSPSSFGAVTALGGGGGGGALTGAGSAGASGGGGVGDSVGATSYPGGAGTSGQGSNGGSGAGHASNHQLRSAGGGGGAGGVGGNAAAGSSGVGGPGFDATTYVGTASGEGGWFASGGGGGSAGDSGVAGVAGNGGGGNGGRGDAAGTPQAGQANTGGGGGGGGGNDNAGVDNANGGAGGSGVVIVQWYRIGISYAANDTFVVPTGVTEVDVQVVAGGGGCGGSIINGAASGGGGAGGYGWWPGEVVTPGASIAVTVGAGGLGGAGTANPGQNGGSSSFGALTRTGGGGGAQNLTTPGSGGSGGGGGSTSSSGPFPGGSGIPGQGFDGGSGVGQVTTPGRRGGGGGGAGEPGHHAITGTVGREWGGFGVDASTRVGNFLYSPDGWFAGGGAGGDHEGSNTSPEGGRGGGGRGQANQTNLPGTDGLGGGAGGCAGSGGVPKAGGRGVVAVLWDAPSNHPNAIKVLSTGEYMSVYYGGEWLTARSLAV